PADEVAERLRLDSTGELVLARPLCRGEVRRLEEAADEGVRSRDAATAEVPGDGGPRQHVGGLGETVAFDPDARLEKEVAHGAPGVLREGAPVPAARVARGVVRGLAAPGDPVASEQLDQVGDLEARLE